ncbi:MAG: DUF166 family protein [Euryarchaeota archaeon]|nr:DUF166 family protein [Euryarchaeota archaeon]
MEHQKVRFGSTFGVGIPVLKISVANGVISAVKVKQSAPCGSTWFVAKKLIGVPAHSQQDIRDAASEAHHSYPRHRGHDRGPGTRGHDPAPGKGT